MRYKIIINDTDTTRDEFAALAAFIDDPDLFDVDYAASKYAMTAAMRACTDIMCAIALDMIDEPTFVRHRLDVDLTNENPIVNLYDHADDETVLIFSLRVIDVDANDGNDES